MDGRHVAQDRLVQTTRAQQSRVDQVRARSCGKHVDAIQALCAVHLGEHLVDHTVGDTGAVMSTLRCDRVELVEEQDTWLCGGCTLEEIAHRLLRGTNVLVENLRTLDTDKVEACLLRDRRRQQSLSTTGVSVQ